MTATHAAGAPSLPWLLVRLKTRLAINRIKTAKAGKTNAAVTAAFGLMIALFAAIGAAASATSDDPRVHRAVLVLGATFLLLGWSLFPLVTFGIDETLDPARLQLFPLRRGPLMTGMLAASFVGIAPLA